MGGWVGELLYVSKKTEKEAVGMSYCGLGVGGWVGEGVGGWDVPLISSSFSLVGGWVGG